MTVGKPVPSDPDLRRAIPLAANELPPLQDLIDLVPDYLWVKDTEGRFLLANHAVAADHSFEAGNELIGLTDFDLHPPDIASVFTGDETRVMETGQPMVAKEEAIMDGNGQRKWLSTTKVPWRNKAGDIAGIVCVARDVTQRRNAEVLREGQSQVLGLVARNALLESSLHCLSQMVRALLPKAMVSFQVIEPDGTQSIYGSAGELPQWFVRGFTSRPSSDQPVEVIDVMADSIWNGRMTVAAAHGNRFCWATPIVFEDKVLGVVAVFNSERLQLIEIDRNMLSTASQLAGLAIERRRATEAAIRMATHDTLTQLPNRSQLKELLRLAIEKSHPEGAVAIAFMDLDHFKSVNDDYGHSVGDALLRTVADRLKHSVSADDAVIRFAGDEFILILANCVDEATVLSRIEQIRLAVAAPMRIGDLTLSITVSAGVHICANDHGSMEEALKLADQAMYRSKFAGRNRIER